MFKLFAKKNTKKETVGLDIGSHSIKVVSIEKDHGDNILTAYNIKALPANEKSLNKGHIIREALEEVDLHPEWVNVSLSGPNVIVRFISLPRMSKEQLDNALTFEAEKYIPFDVKEVVMDFKILGNAPDPGQMRVLLAAAKKAPVEETVNMIEKLGINVNIMDVDPFAVFNVFMRGNKLSEDGGSVLLDLGHSQTNVLISIGLSPCFTRQIPMGGKDISDAICKDMAFSMEKAEECKMGLVEGKAEAVKKVTAGILEDLVKELQLSFGYFENRFNKSISGIYCSGGMAYQDGVIDLLSEKLGLQVKKWNPTECVKISENLSKEDVDSVASRLAVGIGLALRD